MAPHPQSSATSRRFLSPVRSATASHMMMLDMQTINNSDTDPKGEELATGEPDRVLGVGFPDSPDPLASELLATFAVDPTASSASVMHAYGGPFGLGATDLNHLVEQLRAGARALANGDMTRAEGMLLSQGHALQSIFMELSLKATKQDHMKAMEVFLRLALKAQNQCRMTLETLSAIKNPPVVFARQANINNAGQQQEINGVGAPPSPHARTESLETSPTELLEMKSGQRLDSGAPYAPGATDPHLAALGEVNRTEERAGKGGRVPKSRSGLSAPI